MYGIFGADLRAKKRREWSLFFSVCHPERKGVTVLMYRSKSDIERNQDHALTAGEICSFVHMEAIIGIRKQPMIANPSPKVLDATKATLDNIDKGDYTFSSELPGPCKDLFDTVKNLELDPSFDKGETDVSFSEAIRYSIKTEGLQLNQLLKKKQYLRITMGKGRGDSPGNTYVLEIWPPGAKSPIHNHGAVCGIVKILHGTIQNGIFNKVPSTVCDKERKFRPQEVMKIDGTKDDIFWLSPEW